MHEKKAKIVCLVPSWTETLLEANLNVVGRTRFCIHPAEKIRSIPAVGGTKNVKIDEIIALNPDIVILDKEENKKEMADILLAQGIRILVSHVSDIDTAAEFLSVLANQFSNSALEDFADLYRIILTNKNKFSKEKFISGCVLKQNAEFNAQDLEYVIWKNPFMVIGAGTFISDVLRLTGIELNRAEKYPEISSEELKNKYCLFSSEPYPFEKDFAALTTEGFNGALVDGEKISWYGIRNIRFLQSCLD